MATKKSPELVSLELTRDSLKASIDARTALHPTASDDFKQVTDNEQARLDEVTARIAELTAVPAPAPAAPAPAKPSAP